MNKKKTHRRFFNYRDKIMAPSFEKNNPYSNSEDKENIHPYNFTFQRPGELEIDPDVNLNLSEVSDDSNKYKRKQKFNISKLPLTTKNLLRQSNNSKPKLRKKLRIKSMNTSIKASIGTSNMTTPHDALNPWDESHIYFSTRNTNKGELSKRESEAGENKNSVRTYMGDDNCFKKKNMSKNPISEVKLSESFNIEPEGYINLGRFQRKRNVSKNSEFSSLISLKNSRNIEYKPLAQKNRSIDSHQTGKVFCSTESTQGDVFKRKYLQRMKSLQRPHIMSTFQAKNEPNTLYAPGSKHFLSLNQRIVIEKDNKIFKNCKFSSNSKRKMLLCNQKWRNPMRMKDEARKEPILSFHNRRRNDKCISIPFKLQIKKSPERSEIEEKETPDSRPTEDSKPHKILSSITKLLPKTSNEQELNYWLRLYQILKTLISSEGSAVGFHHKLLKKMIEKYPIIFNEANDDYEIVEKAMRYANEKFLLEARFKLTKSKERGSSHQKFSLNTSLNSLNPHKPTSTFDSPIPSCTSNSTSKMSISLKHTLQSQRKEMFSKLNCIAGNPQNPKNVNNFKTLAEASRKKARSRPREINDNLGFS
ncbi:unnamed protein product [Moneuplotes crassus]|uniref:Uncharacterized protein n=1 Tax=Euplotes crassus TaxID=5936 RepID=A0AAD1Y4F7_EUPCR|nr:unnamed protein product [Moneuplotes crassus]